MIKGISINTTETFLSLLPASCIGSPVYSREVKLTHMCIHFDGEILSLTKIIRRMQKCIYSWQIYGRQFYCALLGGVHVTAWHCAMI